MQDGNRNGDATPGFQMTVLPLSCPGRRNKGEARRATDEWSSVKSSRSQRLDPDIERALPQPLQESSFPDLGISGIPMVAVVPFCCYKCRESRARRRSEEFLYLITWILLDVLLALGIYGFGRALL